MDCPVFTDQLTVEAWIETTEPQAEGLQALVSKWTPRETVDGFSAFDAGRIDGLDCRGYFGAVFDGRYIYYVPEHAPDVVQTHAVVLRYDTHAPFGMEGSYEAYDARETSGLDTRGFYGGAFDGRYVYFVPRQMHGEYYHSRLLRYDTRGEFKDSGAWSAYDIGQAQSGQACAFDGRYLYLCPGYYDPPHESGKLCGNMLRYDTRAPFSQSQSYQSFDLAAHFGPRAACYDGAAFDGRYVYFVPLEEAVVARYDTHADFESAAAWKTFDVLPLGTGMFVGAVYDGRWMYFVAYNTGNVVRYDTRQNFEDSAAWQAFNAAGTGGLRAGGYDGGYFDGRYIHFVPFVYFEGEEFGFHGDYLRYDTMKPFDNAASWQARDVARTSGLDSFGYNAGAYDGRYFYYAPWRQGTGRCAQTARIHCNLLRHDTLGGNGSFSLRASDYGHNGGLCAATPGPSFLVNTEGGAVLSVAAHRALPAGRHHLAGVYDGKQIKLLINGEIVAQRPASGAIRNCTAPVAVGRIDGGKGEFTGTIEKVRVLAEATL